MRINRDKKRNVKLIPIMANGYRNTPHQSKRSQIDDYRYSLMCDEFTSQPLVKKKRTRDPILTIKEISIPTIDELFDELHGSKAFQTFRKPSTSVIDVTSSGNPSNAVDEPQGDN
ncbi:hypothetical protein Nepgr_021850 [Nepenthes gracilis]|uniref:Uncharacterized protein n=1 Tax=Nepenthes gracilis TaxID=150966 RepID=A0AAD3XXG2_NEPGR|nr:hypothetical protein Nepgr_021850 [Nepenthes gracilis]